MRRLPLALLCACSVKITAPPVSASARAPEAVAWIGAVDVRSDRTVSETMSTTYMTAMPTAGGSTMMMATPGSARVYTGRLDSDTLIRTLDDRVGREVVVHDLVSVGGHDIGSLAGVQNLSRTYDEHRYLAVVEVEEASVEHRPFRRKSTAAAVTLGVTLGIAYPFVAPWLYGPMDVPVRARATLKVFDRELDRFEHVHRLSVDTPLTVRGVAWSAVAYERLVTEAAALASAHLAEQVGDALAHLPGAPAPLPSAPLGATVPSDPPREALRVEHATAVSRVPIEARRSGTCRVEVSIDADGVPQKVEPDAGCPTGLADAVVASVIRWRFEPVRVDGEPVPARFPLQLTVER